MTLTPKQLDELAHELAADADGMRSLEWMRAHIRGWPPEEQREAFLRRCVAPREIGGAEPRGNYRHGDTLSGQ